MLSFSSLAQRQRQSEIMDQPDLPPEQLQDALRGLKRINAWSGSARILWPAIARLARELQPRPVRILDLATGGGDVPLRLWRRAQRARLPLVIEGCDRSPTAVAFAQEQAARHQAAIKFFAFDALAADWPIGFDVLICSLFLHHLTEDEAVKVLKSMARAAARLVLVNDLERSMPGYLLACWGTRLLSTSPVVHVDGPRSVQGAFTLAEVQSLAERAGLTGSIVRRRWPGRFLLEWHRKEGSAHG